MNIFQHVKAQPFVFSTGLAALIHSTWSLGTMFAGSPPAFASLSLHALASWAYWLVPALLLAFALDVGQIMTSSEIRASHERGHKPYAKYLTFVVLAGATYFLQWVYMAAHMPAVPLADGVRSSWSPFASLARDAALFVVPGLLPISTILYTFSSSHLQDVTKETVTDKSLVVVSEEKLPDVQGVPVSFPILFERKNGKHEEVSSSFFRNQE